MNQTFLHLRFCNCVAYFVITTNSSQSDTKQVKSPIFVKQISGATGPFTLYEQGTGKDCNMCIVSSMPISLYFNAYQ